MRLIRPYYEILDKPDRTLCLKAIERAGRTCYKSEDKITVNSASKFVNMIVDKGHLSVIEHKSMTVKFVCDRGVSHELVRHRIASFSQESTRYCNYSKEKFGGHLTFIIPEWIKSLKEGEGMASNFGLHEPETILWLHAMQNAEEVYQYLSNQINPKTGKVDGRMKKWTPQQARSVLPNSLKTEIVVTANLREWKEIFRQRTSKAAHPQMRELMVPLFEEVKKILPEIFG